MGFFLYLVAMRRWFTVAGIVLVVAGLLGHVRPIAFVGIALIALQLVITIWAGLSEAKTLRSEKRQGTAGRRQESR